MNIIIHGPQLFSDPERDSERERERESAATHRERELAAALPDQYLASPASPLSAPEHLANWLGFASTHGACLSSMPV